MRFLALVMLVLPALATISFRRTGWLDRVVEFTKDKFLEDLIKTGTFKIEVQTPPQGYKDSDQWDFDSVQRLLHIIYTSDSAKPIQRMLEKSLRPSRRYGLSHAKSLIKIPSLAALHPDFFYDYVETKVEPASPEEKHPWRQLKDDDILYISNPIEAHIPSAHISVGHIREILFERGLRSKRLQKKNGSKFTWQAATTPNVVGVETHKSNCETTKAAVRMAVPADVDYPFAGPGADAAFKKRY